MTISESALKNRCFPDKMKTETYSHKSKCFMFGLEFLEPCTTVSIYLLFAFIPAQKMISYLKIFSQLGSSIEKTTLAYFFSVELSNLTKFQGPPKKIWGSLLEK